jgi:hypothetical protein
MPHFSKWPRLRFAVQMNINPGFSQYLFHSFIKYFS